MFFWACPLHFVVLKHLICKDGVRLSTISFFLKVLYVEQNSGKEKKDAVSILHAGQYSFFEILEKNAKLQSLIRWAEESVLPPIDFNGIDNGMMVATKNKDLDLNGHGNHPKYSEKIDTDLAGNDIISGNNAASWGELKNYIAKIKTAIEKDVVTGSASINTLNF
jgi:hypothetical protein